MKQRLLFLIASLLLSLAGVQTAMAQKMIVTKTNDQVIEFKVSQVRDVTFQSAPVTMIVTMKDSQVNKFEMSKVKNAAFVEVHEWVDLELPSGTVWATCNIGAEEPEEYGDYFAWGETKTKNSYSWGTYKWMAEGQADWHYINKYTIPDGEKDACWYSGEEFIGDGKTELEPSDDAAAVKWGGGWRMPSREQIIELLDKHNTTTEWTTQNGVYGRRITSIRNGKSIFLPAAGSFGASGNGEEGSRGRYFSRTLDAFLSDGAFYMYFGPSSISYGNTYRYYGSSIRPVMVLVKEIKLNYTSLTMKLNETKQLTATVSPTNATNSAFDWKSSNPSVATVSADGLVTAKADGSCRVTCTATDGSDVKAECQVTVGTPSIQGHAYVEIGGVKWATMNIGATTVAGSGWTCNGDYYAWGETEPRYATMTHTEVNTITFTWKNGYEKGYSSSNNPTYTNNTLDAEHDAATANWGDKWRTPTKADFEALAMACSGSSDNSQTPIELTNKITSGGIYWLRVGQTYEPEYAGEAGILFVDKDDIGKRVFFPAAGYMNGTSLNIDSENGYYWSSMLYSPDTSHAYNLHFYSGDVYLSNVYYRYRGYTVRPVVKE